MIYKNIKKLDNIVRKTNPVYNIHFVDGPFFEVTNSPGDSYHVFFNDKKNNSIFHNGEIGNNCWIKANLKYFVDWSILVSRNNGKLEEFKINLKDKRVYIALESKSLGDTLAWIPYVEEFRKKHNCKLICSTFLNGLFTETYPDIEFVSPGSVVDNIYAMYRIGWFYDGDSENINYTLNPTDFKSQPLQKTASDILGLDFSEVRPKLKIPNKPKLKKVGIGIHGTSQSKYWNNPTGWQEVVDYLIDLGYEVMLYSSENDDYMGNKHPKGITKYKGGSIQEVIDDMSECEFFIGIGSGLSWLAWSVGLPVVLISGFSEEYTETQSNTYRVINKNVCNGCFNKERLDAGDWNWCPVFKNTERQFECTKSITSEMVVNEINKLITHLN